MIPGPVPDPVPEVEVVQDHVVVEVPLILQSEIMIATMTHGPVRGPNLNPNLDPGPDLGPKKGLN